MLMMLWQPVRKTLVFDFSAGKLRPDVSRLDEAETAFKNFTPHSYLIDQSKTADDECETNSVPDMIRDKSD